MNTPVFGLSRVFLSLLVCIALIYSDPSIADVQIFTPSSISTQVSPTSSSALPTAHVDWLVQKDFYTRLMALPGINTGPINSTKHLLVIFDPNCPMCARQWQTLKPYLNEVRIHWVPIAHMSNTSEKLGAALLAAKNPSAALFENESNFDYGKTQGGYPLPAEVPQWAIKALAANTQSQVMKDYLWGTPTLGFELENGQRYYGFTGLIEAKDIGSIIANLGHTKIAPLNGFMAIKRKKF